RFCLSAGSYDVRVSLRTERDNQLRAFWLQPISAFGWFVVTTFISNSLMLTNTTKPSVRAAFALAALHALS
ncbi:hypothetical protein SAMN04515618_1231, partial [Collimonas sp. OK307]|uniref:hypothetical protein n=1 Tax=Collimonas sp. OK307 TaxID=1801620 RepID=UPI0008F0E296